MTGPLEIAREYFSESEAVESSTLRELLGACSCLQSLVHRCEGRFVVLQVDTQNLSGIVNRGSSKLPINDLTRELSGSACATESQFRWNGFPVRRTPLRMRSPRCSSQRIGCFLVVSFSFWITDGVPTRWTSSRLTQIASVQGTFPCNGARARHVSMPSDNFGLEGIVGLTAFLVRPDLRLRTPKPGFFRLIPYTPVPLTAIAAKEKYMQLAILRTISAIAEPYFRITQ